MVVFEVPTARLRELEHDMEYSGIGDAWLCLCLLCIPISNNDLKGADSAVL